MQEKVLEFYNCWKFSRNISLRFSVKFLSNQNSGFRRELVKKPPKNGFLR